MKNNNLENHIKGITNEGRKVLSVFLTSGFPLEKDFEKLALDVFDAGADLIELGVPFSDPIADGGIIQYSSHQALLNSITLEKTLIFSEKIKSKTSKPLILMGYANPFLKFGIKKLAQRINDLGIDGIIVPDVPVEEYNSFYENYFEEINTIMLVSPTTPQERLVEIGNKSSGFIYCVSVKGTTGDIKNMGQNSVDYVKRTKKSFINKSVLVGFGISDEQSAKLFSNVSDGVIIGTSIIKSLMNSKNKYNHTLEFISKIKKAISF